MENFKTVGFSINEAFKALNEFDDEEVVIPIKAKKRVNEGGINVNLNNDDEIKDAQAALEKPEEEASLQVIDVDADSLEHLKKGVEYVGQMILKCKACHGLHFIDAEKLIEDPEDAEIYNVEDECPNCRIQGKGFTLLGQVGEVPTFSKDKEEVETTEETTVEETPAESEEEIEVDNTVEDETSEENSDDVEADDTEDLDLPKLGDEFDVDDVAADDTEEQVEEETEETVEEALDTTDEEETVEEVEDEKEVVEEEIPEPKVIDFINKILEKDNKAVAIYDNSPDVKKIFGGVIENIPHAIKEYKIVGFNSPKMIINIDSNQTPSEIDKVNYLVKLFNDNEIEDITVFDVNKDEEVFEGKVDDLLDEFKDSYFISFEVPSKITLFVEPNDDVVEIENEQPTVEEALVSDIIKENKLSEYKINNPLANEYWINDAITTGEDLDVIYEQYVVKTGNKDLIERFKKITGFKDAVDEAKEKFEDKLKNNNRPFNEDLIQNASIKEEVEISEDKIYYDFETDPNSDISDDDLVEISKYIVDKFFPLDIDYSLEYDYGYVSDYDNGPHFKGTTDADFTYTAKTVDDSDAILKFIQKLYPKKLTRKDLEAITEDQVIDYFYDYFYDDAWEWGNDNIDVDKYVEEHHYSDLEDKYENDRHDESLNEAATLEAKDELINKVADKIDKAIEAQGINVQTVTDEANPGQIGFLFVAEEDRTKARPIIDKVFKETGCVPGDITESEEDEAFGLTYDKIAIQLGVKLKEHLCKDRKALTEAIKNCIQKGNKYQIKKSLEEGYRYTLVEEAEDEVFEQGTTETTIVANNEVENPIISKVMHRLMEVSQDTVKALKDFYNIDVAPELVLADMIKDLKLIKGDIDVNDLEENDITRKMYNSYEDFYNGFEEILSLLTGETIHTTPEERFIAALRMLNHPNYSKQGIRKAIGSDTFLELAKAGEVPYLSADIARAQLTEEVDEGDGSDLFGTPDTEEDKAEERLEEIDPDSEVAKMMDVAIEKKRQGDNSDVIEVTDDEIAALERKDECVNESLNEDADKDIDTTALDIDKQDCKDEIKSKIAALTQDEWEATKGYTDAINDIKDACEEAECKCGEKINKVLDDIRDEEIVHVGELEELIDVVDDDAKELINDGQEEAEEKLDAKDEVEEVETEDVKYEVVNDPALDKAVADLETKGISPADLEDEEVIEESLKNNEEINPDDEAEDEIDFESDKFDDDLNQYFNENYEDTVLYHTEKGQIDKEGNVILEGYLETEESKTPVKFLLQPGKSNLDENLNNEKVYKVSNNLSEEIFEFRI